MARCKTRYLMRGAGEGHKKTLELGFGKTRRHQEKRTPPQQGQHCPCTATVRRQLGSGT